MKNGRRQTTKFLLAGVMAALTVAPAAFGAVPGDLDRSFDGDGKLLTFFTDGNSATAFDSVVDSEGRLVVVGDDGADLGVARFNPDGTPDDSFGGDGGVTIDSGPTTGGERARAVALDPAGNILVFGDAHIASGMGNQQDLVFARLDEDGHRDPAFDGPGTPGNGVFRLNLANEEAAADIVAVSEGKIVFAAGTGSGPAAAPRVGRLEANGTLDTDEFASPNGNLTLDFQAGSGEFVNALAVQPEDGKILAAGNINGTATYAVARITTAGALDTGFNSTGTIPGVARPPLPAGFISARAADVVFDNNGITVAGDIQRGSPTFDLEAMVSRVNTSGNVVSSFGNTNGFAVLPMDPDDDEAFTSLSSLDGRLFAGGRAGPSGGFVQLAAMYTSAGVLDTSFASPNGFMTSDVGPSSTAVAAPVVQPGIAYLVGNGTEAGSPRIAVSAVCVFTPPACPLPEVPVVESVSPADGSNDNNPRVRGSVPAGAAVLSVEIFKNPACSGSPAAAGTQAQFQGAGIPTPVPDNSTSAFYARAVGANGNSACSPTSVSYTEVTPPPATAPLPAPVKAKKCKKKKRSAAAAKKKCKKKR
jgi:uncharacterized delta-60 repeat protein